VATRPKCLYGNRCVGDGCYGCGGPLGIPPEAAQPQLQQDAFKELINKFAWALGSTYRHPYANKRSPTREYARRIAARVLRDQGYPAQLAK